MVSHVSCCVINCRWRSVWCFVMTTFLKWFRHQVTWDASTTNCLLGVCTCVCVCPYRRICMTNKTLFSNRLAAKFTPHEIEKITDKKDKIRRFNLSVYNTHTHTHNPFISFHHIPSLSIQQAVSPSDSATL